MTIAPRRQLGLFDATMIVMGGIVGSGIFINPYVVARNLAANREYDGPVVCTEPYFMNNKVVYQRLLAGDYDGVRTFNGKSYGSIFREYADCVAQGLVKAYAGSTVIAGATNGPANGGQAK